MATYALVNKNMSKLKTVLEDSGYFDQVTLGQETSGNITYDTVNCYIGENLFLQFGKNGTGTSTRNLFVVYYRGTSVKPTVDNISSTVYLPNHAYQCSGGLVLVTDSNRIIITKNQNNDVTVIWGGANGTSTSTDVVMAQIGAIAVTDTAAYKLAAINLVSFTQTVLVPVCTCSGFDVVSYTPTVMLAVYKQHTTIGHILYNNKRYFFDGYFATEDEEEEAA